MIQNIQTIKAKSLVKDLLAVEKLQLDKEQIKNDPLSYPLKFSASKDQEVAAFISSCLAYGNVKQILKSLYKIFEILGPSPYEKLITSRGRDWKKIIPQDLKHRFNSAEDIGILLTLLGEALRKHGNLEKAFENSIKKNDLSANATLSSKLESFIDELTGMNTGPYPTVEKSGAWFFFPRPSGGSACKRLLLFLKWMTGTGPMTLGLWKTLSPRELLVPVDTHILRLARHLGLTKKKQASWQTAEEISRALAVLTPEDPTRFDFALCHLGISKQCPSRFDHKICSDCKINSHCLTYGKRNNYIKRGKNHILEPAL